MKKHIVFYLLMILAGIVLAQVNDDRQKFIQLPQYEIALPYDGKTPPPLKLDEAYMKALFTLGNSTNLYYCVSATSLTRVPRDGHLGGVDKGWMFVFSNTNGTSKSICVYFDKTSSIQMEHSGISSGF